MSAAAGSGKTSVLAERCAALVCDLEGDARCKIDELLVVTFTDAAAGEMRSRIARTIRDRLEKRGGRDAYLREQLYLLDGASISTIHSFCRTVIQRWFPQAGVDPQASVLSGEESRLLREETLDQVLSELYTGDESLSTAFQKWVDDYAAGNDRSIRETLLSLHDYISSLENPQGWLGAAQERVDTKSPESLLKKLDEIQSNRIAHELELQIGHCAEVANTIRGCWPVAEMHAVGVTEHRANLESWLKILVRGPASAWARVASEICRFEFDTAGRRPTKLSEEDKAAFDAAKAMRDRVKELFLRRLADACCSFSPEQYREGLERIAPYTQTLIELVTRFGDAYRDAKNAQAVVDFNDLQRLTLNVLKDERGGPSDVARQLQRQYRHVLVDEFQDVDPLQDSILRLVSRESADPPEGNLFTVGDIKQSIYRFRLADPELFAQRAEEFESTSQSLKRSFPGSVIRLRENFRSRSSIIDAINHLFRPLMSRSFGGSDYNESAELTAGAKLAEIGEKSGFDRPAVELHLLEPITQQTASHNEEADGDSEGQDADSGIEELEGIEREAYLIGRRILGWMGQGKSGIRRSVSDRSQTPEGGPRARPIDYKDMVILLRSLPHKAAPMLDILRRMGIPARIDREAGDLEGTEFNDFLSLLQVLDNPRQDIPVAAVLRSPMLGNRFNESELVEIRLIDRGIPFHAAVMRYSESGDDVDLRMRLSDVLTQIKRYRTRMRQAPVAEVLWEIYSETNYLSYVCGRPDGMRRRDSLIRLHDLARQFGSFSKQGLRRFLRFVEELQEREALSLGGSTAGPEENLVRIMTIHASKGLEFPVVILADLQKSFNLADTRSNVLLDRNYGIAMRASDPDKRIVYPTLIHQLAAAEGVRESLSEELRVLYVALTRAREHLMLVGRASPEKVEMHRNLHATGDCSRRIAPLQLETARCVLDWLLPAIATLPRDQVRWPGEPSRAVTPLFEVSTYAREATDQWKVPAPVQPDRTEALQAIAQLKPLPADEPIEASPRIDRLVVSLDDHYEGLELASVPARLSVSELKRRWDAHRDPQERVQAPMRGRTIYAEPKSLIDPTVGAPVDAVRRGTATHRFLQLLDLSRSCSAEDLRDQLDSMRSTGRLSPQEANGVLLDACGWFMETELGRRIRVDARKVRREVAFVSRIRTERYESNISPRDERDVILVRGMVDLILDSGNGLEILDYKTDTVEGASIDERAALYAFQVDSYAEAIEGIYRRPVTCRWLVFLHGRRIVDCRSPSS